MDDPTELAAWLRLNATEGIGPASARKLLTAFGSPQGVFDAPAAQLKQVVSRAQAAALGVTTDAIEQIIAATRAWIDTPVAPELRGPNGEDSFRAVLSLGDALYPRSLLRIDDPPLLLYVHARAGFWHAQSPLLDEQPSAIAVVGSRNASTQGIINARGFSQALAQAGWTIVSGLALGIDAAAHEGAMAAAAPHDWGAGTIAVIGTGIDRTYPKTNAALARRIIQQGAIVSEFAIGTPVSTSNFPRRNRIIAGLSKGTLVVEAAIKSGSLITARLAVEQGKEVFAIPGSIHSAQVKGCHALIKQGAQLVESADDVLSNSGFGARLSTPNYVAPSPIDSVTKGSNAIENEFQHPLLTLMGFDPINLDELANRSGESAQILQAQLLELELMGLVERMPGNRYQRISLA